MKDRYDIVVVGAGPGGSNTAKAAAEAGADVLVLEKRQEIGAPKRCGEGLSINGPIILGFETSQRWCINEIWGANVIAPNGKKVTARYKKQVGWVIERKMFDKYLAVEAAKAGADIYTRVEVTGLKVEDGYVKGVEVNRMGEIFEVDAKVVVGADGVESKVARWYGINSTQKLVDIDSAFQYEMVVDLDEPDMLNLYFGNDIAPRGYIWVFPKGEKVANVGIGIGGNVGKKTAKHYLDKWIAKNETLNEGAIIEVNAGGVPVGDPIDTLVGNGLMLVGDSAHQVNAIHGGGIFEASFAGRIAAKVAVDAIEKGDVSKARLSAYEKEWRDIRGEILHRIYKLRKAIELLKDSDLNYLTGELTGEDVVAFANGENLGKLTKVLMKRPNLLKAARELR
ncbi:putative oxidoreductase/MT0587 [archaeon]|nr:putative oxidoreductase/MT0587 [archaeon]